MKPSIKLDTAKVFVQVILPAVAPVNIHIHQVFFSPHAPGTTSGSRLAPIWRGSRPPKMVKVTTT